jgi:hypothetical protein
MPSLLVGRVGSHLAAAATSAFCAVGQDTPNSEATSETARLPDAIAVAIRCRSRSVTRAPAARIVRTGGERSRPSLTKLARVGQIRPAEWGQINLLFPRGERHTQCLL